MFGVAEACPNPKGCFDIFFYITWVIAIEGPDILVSGKKISTETLRDKCQALVDALLTKGINWFETFWWPSTQFDGRNPGLESDFHPQLEK